MRTVPRFRHSAFRIAHCALCVLHCALCIQAPAATSSTVPRLADAEIAANVQLDVAELAAHVGPDGAASLLLGTSDHGTVRVTDPFAVHFAPRRLLRPGEYAVRFDSGYYRDDGTIVLAEDVEAGIVTNRLVIEAVAPGVALASATCDLKGAGYYAQPWDVSDAAIGRTFFVHTDKIGGVGGPGYLWVSNIAVWAWTSERRSATWDTLVETVDLRDSMGTVPVSGLRRWICDRYDGRTGEEWSLYPAAHTVSLAGRMVRLNSFGTLVSYFDDDGANATNDWHLAAFGNPVVTVRPGIVSSSIGGAFRIVDYEPGADAATIYVNADLGTPVTVQACATLDGPWLYVAGQTSAYPATVQRGGVACYAVSVPVSPSAESAFFRARCTVDSDVSTELRIDNCVLYIDGRKAVWKQITVGGETIRVLSAD